MPLTAADATTQLTNFFDTIKNNVTSGVADKALPLIGKLSDLPGGVAGKDPFGDLKTKVVDAVQNAAGADVAQSIVDAINGLAIAGVSAAKSASGGVDVTFATETKFDTGTALLDIGGGIGGFLDLKVNTGAAFSAKLNATVSFAADGTFSLKDQADPELAVGLSADFSINKLGGDLGVAKVEFTDADPTKPEFQAQFGFDLQYPTGGPLTVTPTLTATTGLDLNFATTDVLAGLLPDIKGEFIVKFDVAGNVFGTPTIAVDHLKVDLGSYLGIVKGTFGDIADIFNSEPLSTLVDIATDPIPVLDGLAHKFGLVGLFDKVGGLTGSGDGVITIGDLAAFQSKDVEDILDPWYIALDIISKIRKIGGLANAGEIDFGGGSLVGGATVPDLDPAAIVAKLKEELGKLGLPQEVVDFLGDVEIGGLPAAAAVGENKGFTFGLFENPGDILKILLTDTPVDLVKFDVPPLEFDQAAGGFFPVLGPLGFLLEGRLRAGLDIDVGFDTQGLIDGTGISGFFVTTEKSTPGTPPWENPKGLTFLPVGALDTTLSAGAGIGFAGSSLTINGKFGFGLHAYFESADADGKFRPLNDSFDCVFDPVGGKATVSVNVTIKIGFGPFSIKKNITLAEATLAEFDVFKCPPPSVVATSLAPGLATAIGADLFLNVGDPSRADQRKIVDEHDNTAKLAGAGVLDEGYVIALARDPAPGGGDINPLANPAPTLVPGKLDVHAFGFTQRVDVPGLIKAEFKNGNDLLVIQGDVTTGSDVSGGIGNDTLIGGAGIDKLRGDENEDILSGNDGTDDLSGGTGDDQLSGGKGADRLDGGDGVDTVDYSEANRDTGKGVQVTITTTGDVFGHGGEAEGDRLISIESLIGTDFADDLRAGFGVTQNLVFDGGDGNDILISGKGQDLLFGGRGADHLNGDDAFDGTTYVTSWGAVQIDMQQIVQHGGDAEGDRLFNMEAVEGSTNSDTLLGNGSANTLRGNDGDDTIEGRGGGDDVGGDFGNDLIYGGADGDTLDGGPGFDTLSYEHVAGPVTVDLGASQRNILGLTVFVPGSAPDNIVMTLPAEGAARGISSFENLISTGNGDILTGDISHNRIEGRDGADIIDGDAGFDVLVGGFGGDALTGGTGLDWVYYNDSLFEGVTVDLFFGGFGGTAAGDTFATVENILGSAFTDTLRGNDVDNIIDPNISGAAVTETVDGRGGARDTLRLRYSSVQADAGLGIIGGFDINSLTGGSFLRQTAPLDTVNFSNIERLDVVGTSRADTVYGGARDDRIITGGGDDFVLSGTGADHVSAGRGDDFVAIGTGADRQLSTSGGTGVFSASGGSGIDTYSISLGGRSQAISIFAFDFGGAEFTGTNLSLSDGSAIYGFEILRDAVTGSGDDFIFAPGNHDNVFKTQEGSDVISPGLGTDFVDGGFDTDGFISITGDFPLIRFFLTNEAQFFGKSGDTLILDYSGLADGSNVVGVTNSFQTIINVARQVNVGVSEFPVFETRLFPLYSNGGTYTAFDSQGAVSAKDDFTNIERLIVTGSSGGDFLFGTAIPIDTSQIRGVSTLRGDDVLRGGGGNDFLFGLTGDDTLFGGEGDDTLFGTLGDQSGGARDFIQQDILYGGAGADTFVAGISTEVFYNDSEFNSTLATEDRAIIMDFNPSEGDTIQLTARNADRAYRAETVGTSTILKVGLPLNPGFDEIIAEIRNFTGFDVNASYVKYVSTAGAAAPAQTAVTAPPTPTDNASYDRSTKALAPESAPSTTGAKIGAPAAIMVAGFTVTQTSDNATLKAALDGATGGGNSTLTLEGSADAFGTFDGDPFGLGKGIILSTGQVEDLPGTNASESGGSNAASIPIVFTKIGTTGFVDIFKADLSNLGIDLRSITLTDSNSEQGGSGGIASGFDLDGLLLSRSDLAVANSVAALNSLARLDVFDFSGAGMVFNPGTQSPPNNPTFPYGVDLNGSINGLVDQSNVRFDVFDENFTSGYLSLGRGGSIGFDLTNEVSTNQPLFLYVAEVGANGENLVGSINVSPDSIEPTGDLSTDLGTEGLEGDTTSLTYSFTPKAGDTGFSLDVVLFSEELPEYDGTDLTDLYSIKLNGREIGALSNGAALTIKNLVYAASGDLIFNPVGTGPLADKIKADAYTNTLTITGAVDPGVLNTLTIEIKDGRDGFLDSGLLIKDGSFKTFTRPEFSTTGGAGTGGDGTLVIGGDCVFIKVSLPPGTVLSKPVDVIVTPTGTIDLGAGAGKPITVTFNPGDTSLTKEICVMAAPGATPDQDGFITYEVKSDDPAVGGQTIAPEVFDLVPPPNKPPEITPPSGEIRIAENTADVTTVVATDPDVGQTLTFSIAGGTDKDLFDIDPASGKLRFKSAPDFDKPSDVGHDNLYNVIVGVSDNGTPSLSDTQAFAVRVTDLADTTAVCVKFVSEQASYRNSFGWYDTQTLEGGILFASVEADGRRAPLKPGVSTANFVVDTDKVGRIAYFLVPNGANRKENSADELQGPIKVVQRADGSWAIATVDDNGNVETNGGEPNILIGTGANALFTETSKNASNVDYASSRVGKKQTATTLAGDTADGPTGLLAWEDTFGTRKAPNATFIRPGDGDYNDAVFNVTAVKGKTLVGNDKANTLTGDKANDVISGAGGDDILNGKAGNDRLEGGAGKDRLTGDTGNDTFVFAPGFGNDTITDFDANPAGGQDRLDIREFGITALDFAARVTLADLGADTRVTIDGNAAQTIRLAGIGNPAVVTQDDFLLA